jgi:hypothetical protein
VSELLSLFLDTPGANIAVIGDWLYFPLSSLPCSLNVVMFELLEFVRIPWISKFLFELLSLSKNFLREVSCLNLVEDLSPPNTLQPVLEDLQFMKLNGSCAKLFLICQPFTAKDLYCPLSSSAYST